MLLVIQDYRKERCIAYHINSILLTYLTFLLLLFVASRNLEWRAELMLKRLLLHSESMKKGCKITYLASDQGITV